MNDDNQPHLRIIDAVRDRKNKEELKAEANKKRSSTQKDFYTQSRINAIENSILKEALLGCTMTDDDGKVLIQWTEQLIKDLLKNIKDPGPIKKRK